MAPGQRGRGAPVVETLAEPGAGGGPGDVADDGGRLVADGAPLPHQPPHEVDVLAPPQVAVEASDLLEVGPPHQQRGRGHERGAAARVHGAGVRPAVQRRAVPFVGGEDPGRDAGTSAVIRGATAATCGSSRCASSVGSQPSTGRQPPSMNATTSVSASCQPVLRAAPGPWLASWRTTRAPCRRATSATAAGSAEPSSTTMTGPVVPSAARVPASSSAGPRNGITTVTWSSGRLVPPPGRGWAIARVEQAPGERLDGRVDAERFAGEEAIDQAGRPIVEPPARGTACRPGAPAPGRAAAGRRRR